MGVVRWAHETFTKRGCDDTVPVHSSEVYNTAPQTRHEYFSMLIPAAQRIIWILNRPRFTSGDRERDDNGKDYLKKKKKCSIWTRRAEDPNSCCHKRVLVKQVLATGRRSSLVLCQVSGEWQTLPDELAVLSQTKCVLLVVVQEVMGKTQLIKSIKKSTKHTYSQWQFEIIVVTEHCLSFQSYMVEESVVLCQMSVVWQYVNPGRSTILSKTECSVTT